MIVVSNTSPLTNLAAIGQFALLHELYGAIQIAEEVWEELNAFGQPWPGSREVANSPWISQKQVKNKELIQALRRDLDRGEAATIALAVELKADLVLLDEQDGRHAAQRMSLRPLGVLGILLEAKRKGIIAVVKPHVDNLRQTAGFYLSDAVYQTVLNLATE
jgi:predicted nucleic acid-binding protein